MDKERRDFLKHMLGYGIAIGGALVVGETAKPVKQIENVGRVVGRTIEDMRRKDSTLDARLAEAKRTDGWGANEYITLEKNILNTPPEINKMYQYSKMHEYVMSYQNPNGSWQKEALFFQHNASATVNGKPEHIVALKFGLGSTTEYTILQIFHNSPELRNGSDLTQYFFQGGRMDKLRLLDAIRITNYNRSHEAQIHSNRPISTGDIIPLLVTEGSYLKPNPNITGIRIQGNRQPKDKEIVEKIGTMMQAFYEEAIQSSVNGNIQGSNILFVGDAYGTRDITDEASFPMSTSDENLIPYHIIVHIDKSEFQRYKSGALSHPRISIRAYPLFETDLDKQKFIETPQLERKFTDTELNKRPFFQWTFNLGFGVDVRGKLIYSVDPFESGHASPLDIKEGNKDKKYSNSDPVRYFRSGVGFFDTDRKLVENKPVIEHYKVRNTVVSGLDSVFGRRDLINYDGTKTGLPEIIAAKLNGY